MMCEIDVPNSENKLCMKYINGKLCLSSSSGKTSGDSSDSDSPIAYEAKLTNNGYKVAVAATENYMSEYVDAVISNDSNMIDEMFLNGYISFVLDGTKINVLDVGFGTVKVKILEGGLKGSEVYSINEYVSYK